MTAQLDTRRQIATLARLEPFAQLCDEMCAAMAPGESYTTSKVFEATIDSYGACHERRLYRALRRLVETRRVERSGPTSHGVYALKEMSK